MRLKKLKVVGFKSFAESVTLNFDTPLVALVGPNGCGKSNIVDAIRWVIGEQSAKSMRAERMQDVIFGGSEHRKGASFAEVSLVVELPNGEVTLTRRLHKSGESEYLINKEHVRLKDIQNVFLGSGIGKSAFSIFEQGKLDEIIYLNPEERRAIFDEAAEISRFLQRKKESLKRLEEVSHNFSRLKDIHSEVDKRRKVLKKQADEAKSYQEKKERLEGLEKGVLEAKLALVNASLEKQQKEKDALSLEVQKIKASLDACEEAKEGLKKGREEKEKEVKITEKNLYQLHVKQKSASSDEKNAKLRVQELGERKKSIALEKEALQKARRHFSNEIEKQSKRLVEVEQKKADRESENKKCHESARASEKKGSSLQDEYVKSQKEERKALEEERILEKKEQGVAFNKTRLLEEKARVIKFLEEKKEAGKLIAAKEAEKKAHVAHLLEDSAQAKKETDGVIQRLKEIQAELSRLEKALLPLLTSLQEKSAEEKALLALQNQMEGFSKSAKALLKECDTVKPLYTAFSLKEGFEKGINAFLRAYSGTLLVRTHKELEDILAVCAKKKWTDLSFVVLENGEKFLENISYETEFKSLLKGKKKISVTPEGSYVDSNGVLFYSPSGGETNSFARAQRIKKIESERDALLLEKEVKEKERGVLLKEKEGLEKSRTHLEELWRKKEMVTLQENFFLQQLGKEGKKNEEERHVAEKEKGKLEKTLLEEEKNEAELKVALTHIRERKTELSTYLASKEKEVQLFLKAQEATVKEKEKSDAALLETLTLWRGICHEIEIMKAKEDMSSAQEKKADDELLSLAGKMEMAVSQIEEMGQVALSLEGSIQEVQEKQKEEERLLLELKQEEEKAQKELTQGRKTHAHIDAKLHQLELVIKEQETSYAAFEGELESRFKGVHALALLKTIPESEKEIMRLKLDLEKEALVNMTAIEESKEEERRFSELDRQLADLKGAKEDLEKTISTLDGESRLLFKETFEAIRANFQKNFALFFNGGRADLRFVGSDDPLLAGIEIVAEPKGKQMRAISLLSGGEKCMTALALLFSIFEVKPAPFCILDEVDAPLDDANVGRFTSVLDQYIENTQFVIVTHNKKTMAIADVLFGVSMEEKGVSKLISIEFEKRAVLSER